MNEEILRRLSQLEERLERLERLETPAVVYRSGGTAGTPTDANLDSIFGDAGDLPNGFIGILHATIAGGNRRWLCVVSNGWWLEELTQAT